MEFSDGCFQNVRPSTNVYANRLQDSVYNFMLNAKKWVFFQEFPQNRKNNNFSCNKFLIFTPNCIFATSLPWLPLQNPRNSLWLNFESSVTPFPRFKFVFVEFHFFWNPQIYLYLLKPRKVPKKARIRFSETFNLFLHATDHPRP